jgi:hypothetical protein
MTIAQPNSYLNERLVGYATRWAVFGSCQPSSWSNGDLGWVADNSLLKHMFLNGPVVWSSVMSICSGISICLFGGPEPSLSRPVNLVLELLPLSVFNCVFSRIKHSNLKLCWFRFKLEPYLVSCQRDSSGLSFPGPMTPDVSFAFMALTAAVGIPAYGFSGVLGLHNGFVLQP